MKNCVTGGIMLLSSNFEIGIMPDKIERIKKLVKDEYCFGDDYDYHTLLVVKYAKMLADKLHADKQITELAALLHDIGVKDRDDIHERVGAERAEKILKELDYSEDIIERVKACISTHRTSGRPKSKEAEIIRNADAMAHISALPFLIKIKSDRGSSLDDAIEWVRNKILVKAAKKLTLPLARKIIKKKYDAAKILLKD